MRLAHNRFADAAANPAPFAVAVVETEAGLRISARTRGLSADHLARLRSEAAALLTAHGYRAAEFVINASKEV